MVDGFPCKGTIDNLIKKIWTQPHWIFAIFDRAQSSIYKYHVEALLCQLIAAKLIGTEWKDNQIYWILTKEDNTMAFPDYVYEDVANWQGINVYDRNTTRMYPLESIKNPALI